MPRAFAPSLLTRRRTVCPRTQGAILIALGGFLLIGAIARFEIVDAEATYADTEAMASLAWRPPTRPAEGVNPQTDAGRPVQVREAADVRPQPEINKAETKVLADFGRSDRLLRIAPASDGCNCHGWVFTGGRYWVGPTAVEEILADNGYRAVTDPQPGDLAIYRQGTMVAHTGVVRAKVSGLPVLVSGKWGWMGVFLHPADGSCYGTDITYYRSPRKGHLIAGLTPVDD